MYKDKQVAKQRRHERYVKNKDKIKTVQARWNEDNKQRISQWHKKHGLMVKTSVMAVYCYGDPKCECCGEKEVKFLCMDHIDGDGAEHRKKMGRRDWGGRQLYYWLIKNGFPPGFQVLCFNCNSARSMYGECPHKEGK